MADQTPEEYNLLHLPVEILEHIWCDSVLIHTDICNLSKVCVKCRDISYGIWKTKLHQRWPKLLDKFPDIRNQNWREHFQARLEIGREVRKKVASMSSEFFLKDDVSKEIFSPLYILSEAKGAHFVIDELMSIIHDGNSHVNLTEKYYTEKALRYMQHAALEKQLTDFLSLPVSHQLLETGAVYIAAWCQPCEEITVSDISRQLDNIASTVKHAIQDEHHPIHKQPQGQQVSVLQSSLWSPSDCKKVLEALNAVLYGELGFRGNDEEYYSPENSYINKVLEKKTGIPISLSVVYLSVARRLGVLLEPVNFPAHFLLRWKQHPQLATEAEQYTFIDAFNKGKFLSLSECAGLIGMMPVEMNSKEVSQAVPPARVMERMVRNLIHIGRQQGRLGDGLVYLRTVVELSLVTCASDMDNRVLLARLYLHIGINLTEIHDLLEPVLESERVDLHGLVNYLRHTVRAQMAEDASKPHEQIKPKYWTQHDEVTFKVGSIMKHKRYDYTCVIYGWDPECTASQEWIVQMGVHLLPRKQHQPFYNVLVEDGSNRYAAQENLEPHPEPRPITHPEIGKYFHEYCRDHYLLNAEKAQQYPQDQSEDAHDCS